MINKLLKICFTLNSFLKPFIITNEMAKIVKYACSSCGQEHEGWPALTYSSPTNYDTLSDEDKQNIGKLDRDFCVIIYPDQTDRFIRCTLTQKVIDHCTDLKYGLWALLSEE